MTPEEQRIAIAEACGWTEVIEKRGDLWQGMHEDGRVNLIPDYLNDLNAMHEVEEMCNEIPFSLLRYYEELVRSHGTLGAVLASAKYRAEAFLKTLNLYKP